MKSPEVTPIRIPVLSMLSYVLYIAIGIFLGVLLIIFIAQHLGSEIPMLFGGLLFYSAAVFAHFRFAHGVSIWLDLERTDLVKTIAWGVFIAIVCYIVTIYVAGSWMQNFKEFDDSSHLKPESQYRAMPQHALGFSSLIIMGIDNCIIAPIAEEIIFRSGLYRILKGKFPVMAAAIISSALFALSHRSVVASVPLFVSGFIFCWVYEKTADIRAPIISHAGYNFLVFLPTLVSHS
jgi:membrane protease YdiL (CAAX protease family)